MRRLGVVLTVTVIVGLAACGDDSGDGSGASNVPAATQESTTQQLGAPEEQESGVKRESVDELGRSEPEIQKRSKDQISVGLPGAGPTRFSPKQRAIYELQKIACGAFSPKKTAREYGIDSSDPVEIALQLSKKVARPEFEEAAFKGCLAGFGVK